MVLSLYELKYEKIKLGDICDTRGGIKFKLK